MNMHNADPAAVCPACGFGLGYCSAVSGPLEREAGGPQPGDLSLCGRCAELLIFAEGGKLRRAELADLVPLSREDHAAIAHARRLILTNRPFGTP
jgi:hypothetical protein